VGKLFLIPQPRFLRHLVKIVAIDFQILLSKTTFRLPTAQKGEGHGFLGLTS
jgi:hypothetical protein